MLVIAEPFQVSYSCKIMELVERFLSLSSCKIHLLENWPQFLWASLHEESRSLREVILHIFVACIPIGFYVYHSFLPRFYFLTCVKKKETKKTHI